MHRQHRFLASNQACALDWEFVDGSRTAAVGISSLERMRLPIAPQ
jgi:hypothetical protein